MKKSLSKFTSQSTTLAAVFFLLCTVNLKSQVALTGPQIVELDSVEAVFSTLKINYKTFETINSKLKSTKNISYKGYCSNHEIFLVKASKTKFATDEQLFNHITNLFEKPDLFIRKEGTLSAIEGFCEFNGFDSVEGQESIKASKR